MTDAAPRERDSAPAPGAEGAPARLGPGARLRRFLFDLFSLATLRVLFAAYRRFDAHEGFMLSGYIAYATLLAVFPFLIFATSLAAATIGPAQFQALTDLVFEVAFAEVVSQVQPVLEEALGPEKVSSPGRSRPS
ncbi:MAG: YhjD/YihY/BrkB family envelope integrity protein, partial [Pseudomonadota bacterium]